MSASRWDELLRTDRRLVLAPVQRDGRAAGGGRNGRPSRVEQALSTTAPGVVAVAASDRVGDPQCVGDRQGRRWSRGSPGGVAIRIQRAGRDRVARVAQRRDRAGLVGDRDPDVDAASRRGPRHPLGRARRAALSAAPGVACAGPPTAAATCRVPPERAAPGAAGWWRPSRRRAASGRPPARRWSRRRPARAIRRSGPYGLDTDRTNAQRVGHPAQRVQRCGGQLGGVVVLDDQDRPVPASTSRSAAAPARRRPRRRSDSAPGW